MGIEIAFDCPMDKCGYEVKDNVDDATFDWNDEDAAGEIPTAQSTVQCSCCDEYFVIEVTALGAEKTIKVLKHDNVRVRFTDNSGDYTYILDEKAIDEEIARLNPLSKDHF